MGGVEFNWDDEPIVIAVNNRRASSNERADPAGVSYEGPETFRETAGLRVRDLRQEHDMSLSAFARIIGLSKSQLDRIEKGESDIRGVQLRHIYEAFGISPSEILKPRGPESSVFAPRSRRANGGELIAITPILNNQQGLRLHLPSYTSSVRWKPHTGQEVLLVTNGFVEVDVGRYRYYLGVYDCLTIDATQEHSVRTTHMSGDCVFFLSTGAAAAHSHD